MKKIFYQLLLTIVFEGLKSNMDSRAAARLDSEVAQFMSIKSPKKYRGSKALESMHS